jgi:thiosulfate/3-mercaptopyruvate sulfurtransferase
MKEMRDMRILRRLTVISFMFFMSSPHVPHVAAVGGDVAQAQAPGPLVTTAWLASRAGDANVVVISSDDEQRFAAGHIAGARVMPHERTLGGNHRLLPADALARVLAETGASDTTHVVLYGSEPMATGWLFMAFASLGHAGRVSMLDGNLALWRSEGRPVATGSAPAATRGTLTPRPAPDVQVDAAWLRDRLEKPGVRVLDVRTMREWDAGRLPGATFILWGDLFASADTRRFKTPEEIRALFAKAGVKSGDQVVTYCAVGMRASLMYFAATRIAGLPGRVYVGSMRDWEQQPGYPIVK